MGQNQQEQEEMLRQCLKQCNEVKQDLQKLTQQAGQDLKLKSTLNESVHHIEMCLHECNFAANQAP